ncbi:MAG: DUF1330 domain-containing protein [Thermoanaerobaculia bacterium]|nr:DUF1330 domain-containing protein [Thermoanaerobaculia bacterium]
MAVETLVALQVDDAESYRRYREGMMPLLKALGGRFGYDFEIAKVLKSETEEPINRVFTLRFPDRATMESFFANEEYLKIRNEFFEPAVSAVTMIALYERD